jgi:hypothetical protein
LAKHATGFFDVKLAPLAPDDGPGTWFGRMSIDKRFHGDIEATSKGQMLSAHTAVKQSAGYVAFEQVTGTVQGKRGSFILQHMGMMNKGSAGQSILVVPDSGTEELTGIRGKMTIRVEGGKHHYDFEYSL